jgi:hypothetical protein
MMANRATIPSVAVKRIGSLYQSPSTDMYHSKQLTSTPVVERKTDAIADSSFEKSLPKKDTAAAIRVSSKPMDIPLAAKRPCHLFGEGEKRRNFDPSLTHFQVGSDEVLFHIGANKYIILSRTDGPFRVHRIRICDLASHPSQKKKVIRFNLQQWTDLTFMADTINDMIQKEEEVEGSGISSDEGILRWSLGGNVFVTLRRGMPGLDFRWFWQPPEENIDYHQDPESFKLHPTKYGIWLNYDEWMKVVSLKEIVVGLIPDLDEMVPCRYTHDKEQGLLMCSHCNSNGYHVWQ